MGGPKFELKNPYDDGPEKQSKKPDLKFDLRDPYPEVTDAQAKAAAARMAEEDNQEREQASQQADDLLASLEAAGVESTPSIKMRAGEEPEKKQRYSLEELQDPNAEPVTGTDIRFYSDLLNNGEGESADQFARLTTRSERARFRRENKDKSNAVDVPVKDNIAADDMPSAAPDVDTARTIKEAFEPTNNPPAVSKKPQEKPDDISS